MTAHSVTLGRQTYPVVLPNVRDPRLHVAAVIISIHVLGQVALNFQVSVPQILAAILTCAILEVGITFAQTRSIVWPASAMLTGSGVALILRVVGTPAGDHWTTYAWELFALVAGGSLLTKYLIRFRGTHVFNPSNIGLVVAFVVLGASRVEPLDFWWAPLGVAMLLAYALILGGGALITRRLKLLALAASFWVVLALGTGVLAASGHCMTANWSFTPVCGIDYWRVIVTSPEVMIFLFFMITDPKTVPTGQVGRIAFGALVAVASVLLMAPQSDEFGTKVGLLAGLLVICIARPLLDALVPQPRSAADDAQRYFGRLRTLRGAALGVVAAVLVSGAVIAASIPSRGVTGVSAMEALNRVPLNIDASTLPPISVDQDVYDFDHQLAGDGIRVVLVTLAQNLEVENAALLRHDATLLPLVDHGDRLAEMQARVADATAGQPATVRRYRFDAVDVKLLVPFGVQSGLSLGMHGRGTLTQQVYDAAGNLTATTDSPFDLMFAVRRATGGRWLNVAVLPPST